MEIIVGIIIGLILGLIIGILASRGKKQELITQTEVLKAQMNTSKADAEKHCNELLEAKDKACKDALAAQETRHKESIDNLQERFDETMKKVSAEMKTATDEMLKQRQKEFTDASSNNLGQIVNPLRETIDKMKQAMNDSALRQTATSSEMKVKLEDLMKHSEAYWTFRNDNRDAMYYSRVIVGALRAVDVICSLPQYNGKALPVTGSSQGGALSIITAALDSRVTCLAAVHPALCDHEAYFAQRACGWPHYYTSYGEPTQAERETLRY